MNGNPEQSTREVILHYVSQPRVGPETTPLHTDDCCHGQVVTQMSKS